MIVQRRVGGLRVIAQHDHGLLSGLMASAWRNGSGARLGFELVLAAAVHDIGWQSADARPMFDPETGGPFDFIGFPQADRIDLYARGLGEVARVGPLASMLTSLHYEMMLGRGAPEDFLARERDRRDALWASGLIEGDEESIKKKLKCLQLFDVLSLYLCMSGPGVESGGLPRWLDPAVFAVDGDGRRFSLSWQGEDRLSVDPFPFEDVVRARVPYLALDRPSYGSEEALLEAWERGRRGVWALAIEPPSG